MKVFVFFFGQVKVSNKLKRVVNDSRGMYITIQLFRQEKEKEEKPSKAFLPKQSGCSSMVQYVYSLLIVVVLLQVNCSM